jgi:hypothetical protein
MLLFLSVIFPTLMKKLADCTFLYGKGYYNHHFGTGIIIHMGIITAVKRVEFISDRMQGIMKGLDVIPQRRIKLVRQRPGFMSFQSEYLKRRGRLRDLSLDGRIVFPSFFHGLLNDALCFETLWRRIAG